MNITNEVAILRVARIAFCWQKKNAIIVPTNSFVRRKNALIPLFGDVYGFKIP